MHFRVALLVSEQDDGYKGPEAIQLPHMPEVAEGCRAEILISEYGKDSAEINFCAGFPLGSIGNQKQDA